MAHDRDEIGRRIEVAIGPAENELDGLQVSSHAVSSSAPDHSSNCGPRTVVSTVVARKLTTPLYAASSSVPTSIYRSAIIRLTCAADCQLLLSTEVSATHRQTSADVRPPYRQLSRCVAPTSGFGLFSRLQMKVMYLVSAVTGHISLRVGIGVPGVDFAACQLSRGDS